MTRIRPKGRQLLKCLIASQRHLGLDDIERFKWVQYHLPDSDRARYDLACPCDLPPIKLAEPLDYTFSVDEMYALAAGGFATQPRHPKVTHWNAQCVAMERRKFQRGEYTRTIYIGQCGQCGTVYWAECGRERRAV